MESRLLLRVRLDGPLVLPPPPRPSKALHTSISFTMSLARLRKSLLHAESGGVSDELCLSIHQLVAEGDAESGGADWRADERERAVNLPPPRSGHPELHSSLKARGSPAVPSQPRVCPTPSLESNEHKPRCLWMVNWLSCAQQRARASDECLPDQRSTALGRKKS